MAIDDVDAAILEAWRELGGFLQSAQENSFIDALADKLDDALAEEIPEFVRGSTIRPDLDASTRALLAAFFRAVAEDPNAEIEIPQDVLTLARTMALHNRDVGPLLRAYRIGQRLAWGELLNMMRDQIRDPELRLEVVAFLHDRLGTEIERIVEASVAVFTAERDSRLTGALARKSDAVQAILRGDTVDWDEATKALGHRLRRLQLGLQFWLDAAPESESLRRLEASAQEAALQLGSPAPLVMPDGSRSLSAWLNVSGDANLSVLDRVAESLPGVRIAAGVPAYGVSGFRTSHEQALRARQVARASVDPASVTRYADVEVVSAYMSDPDAMHELVARELGGLGSRDETSRRLRETALAFLRASGSARDAAEVLGVHKNTVLYRIRGIEELLGHPIGHRRLTFEIALHLVEQLGDDVLP